MPDSKLDRELNSLVERLSGIKDEFSDKLRENDPNVNPLSGKSNSKYMLLQRQILMRISKVRTIFKLMQDIG